MEERRVDSKSEVERLGYEMYNGKNENRWATSSRRAFPYSNVPYGFCLKQICDDTRKTNFNHVNKEKQLLNNWIIWLHIVIWRDNLYAEINLTMIAFLLNINTRLFWKYCQRVACIFLSFDISRDFSGSSADLFFAKTIDHTVFTSYLLCIPLNPSFLWVFLVSAIPLMLTLFYFIIWNTYLRH